MRSKRPVDFLDKADKLLMRLVVLTAVALVVVQAMVVGDPFRTVMAEVGSDSEIFDDNIVHWQDEHITFYLENFSTLPHLKVLVNGTEVGEFKDRYLTIPVYHGDLIEIDGTFYEHPVSVQVFNTTDNIIKPAVGHKLTINGEVKRVGSVKMKDAD